MAVACNQAYIYKMNKIPYLILALVACNISSAQDDFSSFGDEVFSLEEFSITGGSYKYDPRGRGGSQVSVPVRITRRADAVTLKLTVSCDEKRPDDRIRLLQDALRVLKKETDAREGITLKTGYVELPLVTSNRSIFSGSKSSNEVSSFDITLITKLGDSDTVFERTAYLNTFIDAIDFEREIHLYYVSTGIAILNPDAYRADILKEIGDEFRLMKETFGSDVQVMFWGLDKRVNVKQLNDTNLELFIPYTMILRAGSVE